VRARRKPSPGPGGAVLERHGPRCLDTRTRQGTQLFLDVPPLSAPARLLRRRGRGFATARPSDFRVRFEPSTGPVERVVWEWAELRTYGRRVR
jgi:hypothetical protein